MTADSWPQRLQLKQSLRGGVGGGGCNFSTSWGPSHSFIRNGSLLHIIGTRFHYLTPGGAPVLQRKRACKYLVVHQFISVGGTQENFPYGSGLGTHQSCGLNPALLFVPSRLLREESEEDLIAGAQQDPSKAGTNLYLKPQPKNAPTHLLLQNQKGYLSLWLKLEGP